MTGYLSTAEGARYQLPSFLEVKLLRTGSVPCDSFQLSFPYTPEMRPILEHAVRFTAQEGETVLLHGILDECTVRWEESGAQGRLEGRGLAALLLDNEVEGASYRSATLRQLLEKYVQPLGLCWRTTPGLSGAGYSVESGASAWKAIADFSRRFGGWLPRFSAAGELLLGETKPALYLLDTSVPVQTMQWQEKRYGVLSEVTVLQKKSNTRTTVRNESFLRQDGRCRRVLYADSALSAAAVKQLGRQRLADSLAERNTVELTVPLLLTPEPMDTVRLARDDWGITGDFTLVERENHWDAKGVRTKLTLRKKEDNDVDF